MATRKISYIVCDGCGRNALDGDVQWAQHSPRPTLGDTFDLCTECAKTRYICGWCYTLRDWNNPCDCVRQHVTALRARWEQSEEAE